MNEKAKQCPFCKTKEVKKRLIAENDFAWTFPTNIPIVPGHVLIVPKRCVATFEELAQEERDALFALLKNVKIALRKSFDAEGFNYAWNEGKVAGQSVPHFHLHVVPRKKEDAGIVEYDPRKFLYRPGSREKTPQDELLAIAKIMQQGV